ncbi:amidohydrolase [Rubeoparvulum massiliense]|uniref:amidohydrolase n=1 Tax=Rubeoparvulum massiliense TaxID=1631346 RepID=UPI00065E81DB|nr:amidohydrolase [Rubeoparvulum massiliense]
MDEKIIEEIQNLRDRLIDYRRDFHRYPEPGWTEFRTASKIIHCLKDWGYSVRFGADVISEADMMGVPTKEKLDQEMKRAITQGADPELIAQMAGGKTGIVAELNCGPGPVIAIRFDMDSNDIQEAESDEHRPYREGFASKNPGAMHACGHDSHVAMGLGTAEILAAHQDLLHGTIRLIFQPGEEGVRGARAMVEAGVVDDVDYILGGHIGCNGGKSGGFVCAATRFLATTKLDVSFTGLPAHAGAAPQEGKNALLAGATAALNLHAISRHGEGASRINVGVLQAGQGRNIIPPNAFLKIETRGETSEIDAYMLEEAKRIIASAAQMYDVAYTIVMAGGTCSSDADPEMVELLYEEAEKVIELDEIKRYVPIGGAEDFAYFMRRVQSHGGKACYYMLGTDRPAGHHNHHFDINEAVLTTGVEMNVRTILRLANTGK